ncbi:hypothetical protein SBRCBS47491_001026 [Sporothrix bragantina]|uniref:Alpha/beta hydrolase fold-3 domain-containing protein n=1 Tax=Sporothrix bragantina TaxID=671064 RepID=A0ABP0AV77_9PEZI
MHNKPCPGYDRPLDIRFHDGPQASVLTKKPVSAAAATPAGSNGMAVSSLISPANTLSPPSSSVGTSPTNQQVSLYQPRTAWDDASMCYFLSEYCVDDQPGVMSGHLDFLPDLLFEISDESALRPAVLASACLCFSRKKKHPDLYARARNHYGQALLAVSTAISKSPDSWGDDVLAAIMLLHMFEDVDGVAGGAVLHLKGIARLYDARGQSLLQKIPGSSLYAWIFTILQIHCLATREVFKCLTIPEPEPVVTDTVAGLVFCVAKISRFCTLLYEKYVTLNVNKVPPESQRDALMATLHLGISTCSETDTWAASLPDAWQPKIIHPDGQRRLVTYWNQWMAVNMTMYLSSLIKFHDSLLCCCQVIIARRLWRNAEEEALVHATLANSRERQVHLLQKICESVPYASGEVNVEGDILPVPDYKGSSSYNLIWPLAVVVHYRNSTPEQAAYCKAALDRVEFMYGIQLHGFGEYAERYVESHSALIPKLQAKGIEVWAMDLQGHGRSPGNASNVNVVAAATHHVQLRQQAVARCLPIFLFGHSLGGLVTAASVSLLPASLAGIVLSAPALPAPMSGLGQGALRLIGNVVPSLQLPRARTPLDKLFTDPVQIRLAEEDPLMYRGQISFSMASSAVEAGEKIWQSLDKWTAPTLVVHGTADVAADIEQIPRLQKLPRISELPGSHIATMDPAQPQAAARIASNATKPSLLAKLATAAMVGAMLPSILALFLIRRLRGQQKDLAFFEDLRRSIIRGVTLLPLRFLNGRLPSADVDALLAAPRLKNFDRQLCLPVSDGLCQGYWVCRGPPGSSQNPRDSDVVIIFYHGGAYCFGDALDSTLLLLRGAEIASAARDISISIFSARYTLAPAGGTFPLQQRQALAAYRHLIDVEKVPAEKIVIAGASAGSHLALTCLLGIAEVGLPKPAAGLLLFPWISLKNDSPSFRRNKHKDVLTKSLLDRCAALVVGKGSEDTGAHEGVDWNQLELVDLNRPLQGKSKNWKQALPAYTWMNVGEHDMFFDDIHKFKKNAEADGARVDVDITPKVPHGWHAGDRAKVNMVLKLQPDDEIPAGLVPGCENVGEGLITVWDQAMRRK